MRLDYQIDSDLFVAEVSILKESDHVFGSLDASLPKLTGVKFTLATGDELYFVPERIGCLSSVRQEIYTEGCTSLRGRGGRCFLNPLTGDIRNIYGAGSTSAVESLDEMIGRASQS